MSAETRQNDWKSEGDREVQVGKNLTASQFCQQLFFFSPVFSNAHRHLESFAKPTNFLFLCDPCLHRELEATVFARRTQ